jgi:predicted phage tail protein
MPVRWASSVVEAGAASSVSRRVRERDGLRGGVQGPADAGAAPAVRHRGGTVAPWSIGEATVGGVPGSIVASLAPEHARGRYQGSFQWTWGIARFATLAVGTTVYATAGAAVVWWFSVVAGVAAALGVGAPAPMISRRTGMPDAAAVLEPAADPEAAAAAL